CCLRRSGAGGMAPATAVAKCTGSIRQGHRDGKGGVAAG
ncbi:unnamed protein product, partial [marine sediment metagenome]